MDINELIKRKKEELKSLCRSKGLLVGGNKHDLAMRLLGNQDVQPSSSSSSSPSASSLSSSSDSASQLQTSDLLSNADYEKACRDVQFNNDLRQLPAMNFAQVSYITVNMT